MVGGWWLVSGWWRRVADQGARYNLCGGARYVPTLLIGGAQRRLIFSERVPARHKKEHINWKEMFAVFHEFLLWHDLWCGGRVRLAFDNTAIVDSINKRSIKGLIILPLQRILLIAAVFDIELLAFRIPSKKNMVADAASRHDREKLVNLCL
jgi:hypothetical protein